MIFIVILSRNKIIHDIEKQSKEYYSKLLKMRTIYDIYDKNPIDQKNHILTVSKEALEGEFKNDVKELIKNLWENPSLILHLLTNIKNKEEQSRLIYIIMNTFYENIFSNDLIDESLFCIIYILLKDEINKLNKKEEKELFLNDTLCCYLLSELSRKPEITKYFRKIIEEVVENLNDISNIVNSSISIYVTNNKINLNVNEIEEQINKKIMEKEKSEKNKNRKHNNSFSAPDNFFSIKFKDVRIKSESTVEKNKNLNIQSRKNEQKYKKNKYEDEDDESLVKKYFDNITKDILIENQKTIEDIKMKEYLQYQLDNLKEYENNNNINNIEGIYTNQTVLKNIYGSLVSSKILAVYQKYFAIAIRALNKILSNFLENINELPYNLRQICKIISILLNKKFPNIKTFERNSFIGIFIIDKIIFPLFQDPKINCLITKIDRNEDFYFNCNFIASLLSDFSLGYFFFETEKNGNYTPFNGYFLEKMPVLMEIYEKMIDVEIPEYIENIINDTEKNDNIEESLNNIYKNYFERHKEQKIYHQSCCLSFGDLDFLLKLMIVYKDTIFIGDKNSNLKSITEKINNNKNYKDLLSLKIKKEDEHPVMSSDKNTKEKKDINLNCLIKPTVEYFIINNFSFLDKYKYFLDINNNIIYLNMKDLDKIQNYKTENGLNNLLKVALCESLFSLPSINELIETKKINKDSLNSFPLIIKDINNYLLYLNSIDLYDKKYLSILWSSNFLLENINNIDEKMKDNYYNIFFNEIENELNSTINCYNFNELASCLNNLTYGTIKQEINEISLLKLKKINTNSIVNKIINAFPIYIKIEIKEIVTKIKENNKINIKTKLNLDIKRAKSKEKKKITENKDIYFNEKNNLTIYKTIDSFIKYFSFENEPKINQYIKDSKENQNQKNKKDIYDHIKGIDLPEKIISFINTTLNVTISDMLYIEKINKTEIPSILLKTNKRIISGLYDLFRDYLPNSKDNELNLKTKSLSWTNITHFTNDLYHLYDSIILFIVDCLKKFEKKKTISGKIICIRQIKNILSNIQNITKIKYNNESKMGNAFLNPLMIFSIIKSQPAFLASDIKFITTFIDLDEKNKIDNIGLIEELKCYLNYILDLNHNNLNGNINKEEYDNLCKNSLLNIKNSK